MEEDKKGKVELVVGKTEACPCYTTPEKATWNEKEWEKHWAARRKGHQSMLARLHKEARE
jgi:hypothetical protein